MGPLCKIVFLSMILSNCTQLSNCQLLNHPTSQIENLFGLVKNTFSPIKFLKTGVEFLFKRILRFPKEISRDCVNDVKDTFISFIESLDPKNWANIMTNWPAQIIDSLAKPPSGITRGNLFWLGNYQQCIDVVAPWTNSSGEKFIGEYCLVDMYPKFVPSNATVMSRGTDVTFKIGLCFPSTCSFKDKSLLLNYTYNYMKKYVKAEMKEENCQTKHMQSMDTTTIVIICILSSYGIFVLSATLVELLCYLQNKNFEETIRKAGFGRKIFLSFAVFRNVKAIFHDNEESSNLRIIHGIRAVSILWIITGHTAMFVLETYPWRNQIDVFQTFDYFLLQPFMFAGSYSVTSFFVLSGFLVSYLFIQRSYDREQSPNIFGYYIFRYLRLTAPLILLVLFLSGPFYYINKGPLWPNIYENNLKLCRRLGWMSILYIQNFVADGNSCFRVGWYLSADTQLYMLAPIILYPLYRKPFLGIMLMCIFSAIATIVTMSQISITGQITFFGKLSNIGEARHYVNDVYQRMYYNAPSFIIGMAAGYLLHFMQRNRIMLLKKTIISCWICALTIMVVILYGTYPYFNGSSTMSPWLNVLYGSLARPTWALAVSWVILACALGYGGIVNRLLTLQPFVIMGRLTYCAYLVHITIIDYYYYGQKDGLYFSIYNTIMAAFSIIVLTVIMAILLAVVVEMPMVDILKHLRSKFDKSSQITMRNQLTFSDARCEKGVEICDLLSEDSSEDENVFFKN